MNDMKKIYLLAVAAAFAVTTSAQVNVAAGATATASSGNASLGCDKQSGTRWESASNDDEWWSVDLGESRNFDKIEIEWEAAYTKEFKILASNNSDFTDAVEILYRDEELAGPFPQTVSYDIDTKGEKYRYVKFQAIKRGTGYGNSFWEFKIIDSNAKLVVLKNNIDYRGFAYVEGEISNETKAILESEDYKDVTGFNLRDVTIADDYTGGALNFANKNAMIMVSGEIIDNAGVPDAMYSKIEGTNNLVVRNGQGYIFPVSQLTITDGNDYPYYDDFFISTWGIGYKYTRTIPANTWASVCLSGTVNAIPEGLSVYELVGFDGTTITFNKAKAINEKYPYFVVNDTDEPVNLVQEGTGDLKINYEVTDATVEKENNLKVYGTLNETSASDFYAANSGVTAYGLQGDAFTGEYHLTLRKFADDARIVPFRAFITLPAAVNPSAIAFSFGGGDGTTGITDVDAEQGGKASNVYTIDGRLVKANATSTEGLAKGLYIMNGKKIIVK